MASISSIVIALDSAECVAIINDSTARLSLLCRNEAGVFELSRDSYSVVRKGEFYKLRGLGDEDESQ